MMKISLILEAVNRATGPIRQVTESLTRMGGAAAASARRVGGSMMYMRDQVIDATHHFRRLAGPEGIERAGRSMEYFKGQVSGLTGGLTLLKYAGVAAVIGLGEEFVRGVFTAGGETQRMLVTLNRLEGSALKARQAMSWMQTFGMGAGASFSMPDIMRSYQMAKNFGMDPQGGSLAAFADLAAGERVPLKQVLIAVKDAMEGTSSRPIANLGIKMMQGKKAGEPNSYLYSDLAGKFVTEHSEKNPEAVLHTLVRIINSKYLGLATAQAKTVPGGLEQMHKLLYLFQAKVAQAGVFDWALAQMNRLFAWVRKAAQNGDLDRLAKRISNFITGTGDAIVRFIANTRWSDVERNLRAVAGALMLVAGAVKLIADLGGGGLSGLFNVWLTTKIIGLTRALVGLWPVIRAGAIILRGFIPILWGIGRAFVGLVIAGGPIVWIIALIGALVVAGILLWRNWSTVSRMLGAIWRGLPAPLIAALELVAPQVRLFLGFVALIRAAWTPLGAFFARLWKRVAGEFGTGIAKVWNSIPAWLRTLLGGAIGGVALGPAGMALGAAIGGGGAPKPAPRNDVGGHIVLELRGDHRGARVTQMRATNPKVGLSVKRGPVLAGG